jgi:hypothetical protein
VPLFSKIPYSSAASISEPSREIPSLKRMSNSADRNGGATLFFTTFTLTRAPTESRPDLMISTFLMSSRTDE